MAAELTAADIVAFAAREGNKMIEAQVNMKARLFAALDKQQMKGRRSVINIVDGGLSSTTQVEDFGALPSEAANVPAQGFVDAVGYVSRLGLGRIALHTLAGVDDSADLLDLQLQIAADDMARQIGRAMFGNQLASPQAGATWSAVSGGSTSVTIPFDGGIADFREGEAYVWEADTGAANLSVLVLCTDVAFVAGQDNRVNVTFVAGVGGVPGYDTSEVADGIVSAANGPTAAVTTADAFYLRGSRVLTPIGGFPGGAGNLTVITPAAANAGLVTLDVVTSPTLALHGLAAGSRGWTGITFSSVGSPTAELFMGKSKLVQARAGTAPTHLVLGALASAAYGAQQITAGAAGFGSSALTQPRRAVDGKLDKYGKDADMESGLSMFGRPVLVDDNCPTTNAYLINKDYLKVGEWKKLSAEDEGGSPLLLSRSTFSKEVQYSCIYNLICRKRNSHAKLSGLTIV